MTYWSESGPDFLQSARVAIVGLGLMGGSLAMALRGKCQQLIGIDTSLETIELAKRISLCDSISSNPAELLPEADLVILAAPIRWILALIHDLPTLTSTNPIVMDLGSTKTEIIHAMNNLPPRFDPIGAHPMCGKERSSLVEAEAGLFSNAPFALVPLPRTSELARAAAAQLVQTVGARPIWLNETTHDRWVAATSHVPFLIANALANATPPEVAPLVGSGYRSTTRVSTSPSSVMLDILSTNRANVLEGLNRFRSQLDHLEQLLRDEEVTELGQTLDAGAARQRQLLITAS